MEVLTILGLHFLTIDTLYRIEIYNLRRFQ